MNTQWETNLLDDHEIDAMMAESYPGPALEAFRGFPLGVMRADMWRYAVLLRHGGFYADVDCICMSPANDWDLIPSGGMDSYKGPWLVVALENDVHFCNWAFAASPGHPAVKRVVELIAERYQAGIDYANEHFVHFHTGPSVWTDAICQTLETANSPGEIFNSPEARVEALNRGIVILDWKAFGGRFCKNEYGSVNFGDGWASWTRQREELLLAER